MTSQPRRLVALTGLLAALFVAVAVVVGLSGTAGPAGAAAGSDVATACPPREHTAQVSLVTASHTASHVEAAPSQPARCATRADVAKSPVSWTYQQMSTDRSPNQAYLGTPGQQWLVAGGLALVVGGVVLARRRLRA